MPQKLDAIPSDAIVGDPIPDGATIGDVAQGQDQGQPQITQQQQKLRQLQDVNAAGQKFMTPPAQTLGQQLMASFRPKQQLQQMQQIGQNGKDFFQKAGDAGVFGKGAVGFGTYGSGLLESAGRIGNGMMTKENMALAAIGLIPGMRAPMAAGMMAQGATDAAGAAMDKKAAPADKLERELLGLSGVAMGVAGLKETPKPMDTSTAVDTLSKVTSKAKDMPGARETWTKQLDTIAREMQGSGAKVDTAQDAIKVINKAAENDPYRRGVIEPNRLEQGDVTAIPNYKGQLIAEGKATIEQLDQRLSTINDTLEPRYRRGGVGSQQARAAIGAEQATKLREEANGIRDTIAYTLGKKLNIDPKILRGMRANYEQLRTLSADIQSTIDRMEEKSSNVKNQPVKVGNLRAKAGEIQLSRRTGLDKTISKVFSQYRPPAPTQAGPFPGGQPDAGAKLPRKPPAWKTPEGGGQQSPAHGSGATSVEELSRPGTNWTVTKNGKLTYHGKQFDPGGTQSGSTHVTVLPDGTFRVNEGSKLTPGQEAALKRAMRELASPF